MIDFNIPVEEEIHYLANVLTDEQRKAIFAKMGGGGGGGGGTPTYTRADNHGTTGGRGGGSGVGSGMTVSTTRNGTSGGGYHYTGAGDMTSSWVTKLSPDQMKEEYKNDPDRLKAAIEEQLRMGAYDGISINGHKPSVNDIINGGIAPNYAAPARFVTASELEAMKRDPLAGATAQAIMPGDIAAKTGQDPFARFSTTPTQQVKQDITGTTSTGGGGGTSTPAGGGSTGAAGGGGGGAAPGDIGGAIGGIDVSGAGGGPTAAEISAANLNAFQQALAHAHF